MMWQALLGLIPSLVGLATQKSSGPATPTPERPKPEFQPLQRPQAPMSAPMNFDPGATGSQMQDPQLEALARFRARQNL